MKISNRINKLFFLACASVSIAQLHANDKVAEPIRASHAESEQKTELVNALLQNSLDQLNRLDQITEHIARLISDRQIQTLADAKQALHASTLIRSFIKELLNAEQSLASQPHETKISVLMELTFIADGIAQHLHRALKNGLKNLSPFGIEEYTQFREKYLNQNNQPINPIEHMRHIHTLITKLQKMVNTIGLTWYNKLARRIDNAIITPIQRNNLGPALAIGTLSAISAWFLIGEYGESITHNMPESPFKTILQKLQRSWGNPIGRDERNRPMDSFGNEIPNIYGDGYTWRSRMADSAKTLMKNPFSLLVVTLLGSALYQGWNEIKDPIAERITNIWNRLRGGAYLKSKSNGIWRFEPTHGFEKIIGLDTVKAEFSILLQFLKDPEGSIRRGLIPAKAYLLTGEPGVGKTFMVEGLCGEIADLTKQNAQEFRFLRVDAPLIHHPRSGGITGILQYAQDNAPCVIFIDEIDLLGLQRTSDNKLLSEFLTSMGNTVDNDPMKLVVFIAATNKSHMLDKALLRTGRFKEIRIEHPTFQARKEFLHKELSSYGLNVHEFDIDALARETDQHTIEDLRSLIRRGIITSWIIKTPLNQALLDYGLNKELHRILLEDDRTIPQDEQKLLAAYFAGRAFALNHFNTPDALAKVTIKPVMTQLKERTALQDLDAKEQAKIEHGGVFTMPKHIDSIKIMTKKELLNMCKAYVAGSVAQELLLKNAQVHQNNSDHEQAFICAQRYVLNGLDPEKLSTDLKKQYQEKAHKLLLKCKQEVKRTLKPRIKTLQALAQELEENVVLSGKKVKEIVEQHAENKSKLVQS